MAILQSNTTSSLQKPYFNWEWNTVKWVHKIKNINLKFLCGVINTLHTLFLPSFRSLRSSFSSSVTFLSRMPLSFVFELFSFFSGFSTLPPPRVMASSNCCCLRSSCLELCGHTSRKGKQREVIWWAAAASSHLASWSHCLQLWCGGAFLHSLLSNKQQGEPTLSQNNAVSLTCNSGVCCGFHSSGV